MKTGTVIKANRKEIGISVLWDGDAGPVAYRHDDVADAREGATDMLDGRGVRVGDRVEQVRTPDGWRPRFTGESFAAEPDPAPTADLGIQTAEQFEKHLERLHPTEAMFQRLEMNHLPTDDDSEQRVGRMNG